MLHTTFRKAQKVGACIKSYKKMAKALGGISKYGVNTPIPLDKVLEVCGLDDTLWCLHITIESCDREARLFACDCAERGLPIYEARYSNDRRPRQAIETSRKFANGQATSEELAASWAAAAGAAAVAAEAAGSR